MALSCPLSELVCSRFAFVSDHGFRQCFNRQRSVVIDISSFHRTNGWTPNWNSGKEADVSSSLSIAFVTHNSESSLTPDILNLLDIAGDLSSYVELLIIDDGSTDETLSVAHDLARRFPQVYVHHNSMRYGTTAAMQTAMRETVGEFVVFCTEMPSVTQLRKLWSIRTSPKFVMGQPSEQADQGVLRLIHRPAVVSQFYARSDDNRTDVGQPTAGPFESRHEKVSPPKRLARGRVSQ